MSNHAAPARIERSIANSRKRYEELMTNTTHLRDRASLTGDYFLSALKRAARPEAVERVNSRFIQLTVVLAEALNADTIATHTKGERGGWLPPETEQAAGGSGVDPPQAPGVRASCGG